MFKVRSYYFLPVITGLLLSCSSNEQKEDTSQTDNEISVTVHEGTNMAAALSPDKKWLAIDLQGTIWVMPSEGGDATPITDAMSDCHEPVWSPNGEVIAFHSYKDGNYHIWTVRKDGSDLTQLTDGLYDDREPTWSASGDTVVFSSDRNGNYDIWQVDLGSGAVSTLTTEESNQYHPAKAPDATKIAYVSEVDDNPGIYVMDNGQNKLLAPSQMQLSSPSWSMDGNHVVFTAYDGSESKLFYSDNDGAVSQLSAKGEDIFPFRTTWLDDSTFIYTADGKIKKRKIGGEGFETIPFEATLTLNRPKYTRKKYDFDNSSRKNSLGIMGPVLSPDGSKIAFTALGDIYIQEVDGGLRQITDDPFVELDPDWSPDGESLVFTSDRGGKMDLWLKNLKTNEDKQITDIIESALAPRWSPDGTQIAFYATDPRNVWGSAVLTVLDIKTGKTEDKHDPLFVPSKPSWSPDGKTIATLALQAASTRYREGMNEILLVSVDGGEDRYVMPDTARTPGMRGKNGPIWSPDGKKMAYIQDGVLWMVPVTTTGTLDGEPVQLTEDLATAPSWSGDSKSLLYMATDHMKMVYLNDKKTKNIKQELLWQPEMPQETYVVHAGKVFNGLDSTYLENMDILVEGHRIREIVPHQTREGIKVVDATDKVVIPGLFEMHTHQHASVGERLGKIWLSYGITSIREPGADPYDALERKEAWSSGTRPGPREFFTGGLVDGGRIYYGLANSVIHGPHMKLEMERAEKLGYDMIKTYVRMPDSIQKEITTAAHAIGIPVSSHELYPAMKYNVDAVEHIRGTSRRGYSMKQSELNRTYDDVIQMLAHSGMNITPTIGLQGGFFLMAEKDPEILKSPQLNALYSKDYVGALVNTLPRIRKIRRGYGSNFEEIQETVVNLVNSGGHLTAGTDSPFIPYGTSLHVELQLFVDGGLSPFQALQSATIKAAEAVGVEQDLGTLEPGKLADMVIVDGDPLVNIKDAWNVKTVFKNGIPYEIDELLD